MSLSCQAIVESALDLPARQRNAYIENACAGDQTLKHNVLVLLTQSDNEAPENIPDSAKSVIGETVGPYKIESIIGAGGMGMIHKATDTRLGRQVALKCLPPHMTVDNNNRERFLNEARAVSTLDHPNICTLYDIGETDDKELYLAMPYYQGYTLDKRIENGPLPFTDAIDICLQICEGLHAAHSHNIVHRDIKPANIIVTAEGIIKILDFGVAKISGVNLTSTGVSLGTVAYMSPEQLEGKKVDARADIWAVGVLLYEMLTGERPFQGDQAPAIIHAVLYADLPDFSLPDPIPQGLSTIIRKALTRDLEQRYASFNAFMADLKAISRSETIPPYSSIGDTRQQPASKTAFDEQTINQLISELTSYVGPIAPVLVKKAANTSETYQELVQHLDQHLPDDETRQKMRQRFDILSSSEMNNHATTSLQLGEQEIQCMVDVTTSYVGPIAKLLVQRYSKKVASAEELCNKLAEHIENTQDKNNFLDKAKHCL